MHNCSIIIHDIFYGSQVKDASLINSALYLQKSQALQSGKSARKKVVMVCYYCELNLNNVGLFLDEIFSTVGFHL